MYFVVYVPGCVSGSAIPVRYVPMSNAARPPGVPCSVTVNASPARSAPLRADRHVGDLRRAGAGRGVVGDARATMICRFSPVSGFSRTVALSPTLRSPIAAGWPLSVMSVLLSGVTT